MCIFVVVLASVAIIACFVVYRKQQKHIKRLEATVEYRNIKIAKLRARITRLSEQYVDVREELAKTPARGADGRYTSRRKQ